MNDLWTHLEQAMNEQLAGIVPPVAPKDEDQRSRLRDATPLPIWTGDHMGGEL